MKKKSKSTLEADFTRLRAFSRQVDKVADRLEKLIEDFRNIDVGLDEDSEWPSVKDALTLAADDLVDPFSKTEASKEIAELVDVAFWCQGTKFLSAWCDVIEEYLDGTDYPATEAKFRKLFRTTIVDFKDKMDSLVSLYHEEAKLEDSK